MCKRETFEALIPELKRWNEEERISVDGWIRIVGDYDHAIGYSSLFWPAFTEFEDCILFADFSESIFRDFWTHPKANRQSVEAVMNHRHLGDWFGSGPDDPKPTRDQVLYLGRILRDCWDAKLRRDFPDRRIEVFWSEEFVEDLADYEITFYQV